MEFGGPRFLRRHCETKGSVCMRISGVFRLRLTQKGGGPRGVIQGRMAGRQGDASLMNRESEAWPPLE